MNKQLQIKEWINAIKPLMDDIKVSVNTKTPEEMLIKVKNLYRTIRLIRSVEMGKTTIQGFNFKKIGG